MAPSYEIQSRCGAKENDVASERVTAHRLFPREVAAAARTSKSMDDLPTDDHEGDRASDRSRRKWRVIGRRAQSSA